MKGSATQPGRKVAEEIKDLVLEHLDPNRLIDIAKNVAEIVSITGEESAIAHYLGGEFERLGMEVRYQEVEEGRPNVIGPPGLFAAVSQGMKVMLDLADLGGQYPMGTIVTSRSYQAQNRGLTKKF